MNYESLVGSAARLVRRRWYLFLLGPVVGALLVIPLQSSSSYRAEQVIRVDELENVGAILGAEEVPDVDLDRLTQQAQIDFDRGDQEGDVSASYTANLTARSVTLTVLADSAGKAEEQLDELANTFSDLVTGPLIAQLDVGIANADATLAELNSSMERASETLAESGGDAATTAVIAGSLRDTNDQIVETSDRRATLVGLRDFIADDLVAFGSTDTTAPGTGKTALVAGALAGTVLAAGVALAIVFLDHSVRRLVHIERCAPEATPLGATGQAGPADVPETVRAAVASFAAAHAAQRIVVVGLGRQVHADGLAAALSGRSAVPVVAAPSVEAAIADASPGDSFVATVSWGRATEDQVSAAITAIVRADAGPVAAILTDVPERELDWAASRRSIAGPTAPIESSFADTLPG